MKTRRTKPFTTGRCGETGRSSIREHSGTCTSFESQAGPAYDRLSAMTPGKPIFVLESGATMNNPVCGAQPVDPSCQNLGGADLWADRALENILINARWREPRRGFSWWNGTWENDESLANNTNMRVQDVPCLKEVFRKHLSDIHKDKIVDTPIL